MKISTDIVGPTTAGALTVRSTALQCDIVIGSPRELVRITADGQVVLPPGVPVDDAAKAFWEAVRSLGPAAARTGAEDARDGALHPAQKALRRIRNIADERGTQAQHGNAYVQGMRKAANILDEAINRAAMSDRNNGSAAR
ncbi:MAG TPA: hypothetical protein VD865_08775 [Stenotrophomonas sp.]|nr:hypothetical protein [Stenotrophomonas sp.]